MTEPAGDCRYDLILARKVRAAREAAGLAQSGLERRAGLPFTTIARLERGEGTLTVQQVASVADVLGVDVVALIPTVAEVESS